MSGAYIHSRGELSFVLGQRADALRRGGRCATGVVAIVVGCTLAGCSSLSGEGGSVREATLVEFSQPAPHGVILGGSPASAGASALHADDAVSVAGEQGADGDASTDAEMPAGSAPPTEGVDSAKAPSKPAPPTTTRTQPPPPPSPSRSGDETEVREGSIWIVDALVGQINGRPIFAQEFFESLEAQLLKFASAPDRLAGWEQAQMLIEARFQAMVNDELIISEAEGQLTPEQQQGFFAWVKSLQEGTIAEFSGSREEAKERLLEEEGRDLEGFIRFRRDRSLVQYLLDKKVKPRTIVAWRDIEREYLVRGNEFNPPPLVSVGRLSVNARTQAELAAKLKERAQSGAGFAQLVSEFGEQLRLERGGILAVIPVKPQQEVAAAIEESDLAATVRASLRGLTPGAISAPVERGDTIFWFAIADVRQDPPRSLYDPEVQIKLRREIDAIRGDLERDRYIDRLRSRWVSDDIAIVLKRLRDIALERYWRQ